MRALVVIALVVGCGDGAKELRREASLETFTTRMCQCIDKPCAVAVNVELAQWSKVRHPNVELPPEQAAELMKRYNGCMQAALLARSAPP